MGAVILCEFPADESVKTLVLDSVALLAIEGSGELLFAGRHRSDIDGDREVIAVRLGGPRQADVVIRAWRLKGSMSSTVSFKTIEFEPMRPFDNPLMIFP